SHCSRARRSEGWRRESLRAHYQRHSPNGSENRYRSVSARFSCQDWCIQIVLDAAPDIYNHNMETVERLTPMVRSRAKYRTSLQVLKRAKELSPTVVTKSGVMLGLGETEPELFQTMDDLREVGVQVLTMGQYLRPTPQHLPVVEYIAPAQFEFFGEIARKKGFEHVASGPLVRSSYHAADFHPVVR